MKKLLKSLGENLCMPQGLVFVSKLHAAPKAERRTKKLLGMSLLIVVPFDGLVEV